MTKLTVRAFAIAMALCAIACTRGTSSAKVTEKEAAAQVPAASTQAAPAAPLSQPEIESKGRRFLNALLVRDETTLRSYETFQGQFFRDGRLTPEISEYLYGADRQSGVIALARRGPLGIMLDAQKGNDLTLLFYLKSKEARMRDSTFLQEQYRVDYFACDFTTVDGQWKLRGHFCYDETEGPFPVTYDVD